LTKVALRGLAQRKLRAFVTALAVLLGVAFIAGSFVLTDTINRSFDDIFDEAYAGTDVAVSSSTTGQGDSPDVPAFPERYLDRVRQVDGVEKAAGGIFSVVRFVDAEGDSLGNSFAPNFVSSTAPEPFETLTYTQGRPPTTADQASIDESTADREDLEIGGTLRIAGDAGVKNYRIVGIQRLGDTSSGGAGTAGCRPRRGRWWRRRSRPAATRCATVGREALPMKRPRSGTRRARMVGSSRGRPAIGRRGCRTPTGGREALPPKRPRSGTHITIPGAATTRRRRASGPRCRTPTRSC
jgi:hypothetical protein